MNKMKNNRTPDQYEVTTLAIKNLSITHKI